MSNKNLAPFSDPERTLEMSEGAIVNDLVLPVGTVIERIGLDVEKLERITRWAGAKQLILTNGMSDQNLPDIQDIEVGSDGVAVLKGLQKNGNKKVSEAIFDDTNPPFSSMVASLAAKGRTTGIEAYKAESLTISFDREALKEKVINDKKNERSFTDEASWARVLDREIRSGVLHASVQRYLSNGLYTATDLITTPFAYPAMFESILTGKPQGFAIVMALFKALQLTSDSLGFVIGGVEPGDVNWTLMINGFGRIDRVLATAATGKLGGKVVKLAD